MTDIERVDEEREFREEQRSGIGATDTPKILGLSRYGTPRTVYERLLSPPDAPDQSSLPAWVGMRIQGTVAELYTAATGYRLRAARQHYRHPEDEWIVCHLDYRVWGRPKTLVECKTRARMVGWGEDGSQVVPRDVWAQCQHEMLVTGATECHVAVLFGHHTFRVYPLLRSDTFLEALRPLLRDFWHDNVLARVPPPLTGHERDAAIVARDNPASGGVYRNATPAQATIVNELREAVEQSKVADYRVEQLKTRIKEMIGPALGLIGPFGRITWKKNNDSARVDWEAVAIEYRRLAVAASIPADALDAVIKERTTVKEGPRVFTMDLEP